MKDRETELKDLIQKQAIEIIEFYCKETDQQIQLETAYIVVKYKLAEIEKIFTDLDLT